MRQDLSRAGPRRASERKLVLIVALAVLVVFAARMRGDEPRRPAGRDGPGRAVRPFEAGRFFGDVADRTARATPPGALKLPDGFRAELLYTVPRREQGSWVCLTVDPRGRLIASAQEGGLYRVTPPPPGGPASDTRVEPLGLGLAGAQGLLHAFGSLYAVVNAPGRSGLYLARDTDGDDRYDAVQRLRRIDGDGEHGPHGVVLGPGGKDLYIVGGNGCYLATPPESSAVPGGWAEDRLQRRIGESDGAFKPDRPGGWVCRTDPEGRSFELVAMGLRNPYDLAFSPSGELFTYDSDMEWDAGTPWYRPTRINHVIDGADFGWRAGTSKWPDDYLDSFGSVVDVGFGSPTGVAFGTGTRFPDRYRRALFVADWSYGNIYTIHLEPRGASYSGSIERFASGAPLAVTDLVVRPQDGALYFTVGGRGTTSALYRVTYRGAEPATPAEGASDGGSEVRRLRHRLEAGAPLDLAWAHLSHADRAVRHAARVALERHPPDRWRERALNEPAPRTRVAALVALARRGDCTDQPRVIDALGRIDWSEIGDGDRLDLLRAYELAALRPAPAGEAERLRIVAQLDRRFPSGNDRLDRELAEILSSLEAPGVIPRTLVLLERAATQEHQIHLAMCLRDVPRGWTVDQKRILFGWLLRAGSHRGGMTFGVYMEGIRSDFRAQLDPREEAALGDLLRVRPAEDAYAELRHRPVVKKWTIAELLPLLERRAGAGDPARGRKVFTTALCYRCHRFAGEGAMVGPDLTGAPRRFNLRDLLEAIVEPNRVVSDQYRTSHIALKDGRVLTGKIKDQSGNSLVLMTDPLNPAGLMQVARDEVEEIAWSASSMMPEGLLDSFTEEELADLLAFLLRAEVDTRGGK